MKKREVLLSFPMKEYCLEAPEKHPKTRVRTAKQMRLDDRDHSIPTRIAIMREPDKATESFPDSGLGIAGIPG